MSIGCLRAALSFAAVALLALGCGGDDEPSGTAVNCSWLEAEENCWRAAIREAHTCFGAPAQSERGVFNAARDTCTYSDGRVVRFTEPVPSTFPEEYEWNYDVISASGETCLEFRSTERTSSATSSSGPVEQSTNADLDVVISCPDGARFRIGFEEAFSCLFSLPGSAWSGDETVSVSALGGGSDVGDFVYCGPPL